MDLLQPEKSRGNPPAGCGTTGQTELGGDVGDLSCVLIPGSLKHAERSGSIACGFVQCQLGGRSKTLLDSSTHVPSLHAPHMYPALFNHNDGLPGQLGWRADLGHLSSQGLSSILLPPLGALGAGVQKFKLLIMLVSAATLTFGGVST